MSEFNTCKKCGKENCDTLLFSTLGKLICLECKANLDAAYLRGPVNAPAQENRPHTYALIPPALLSIAACIRNQDNRITDQPMFIVEQKIRDYGYDSAYSDKYEWRHTDLSEIAAPEEVEKLEELDDSGDGTYPFEKVYYNERWEFVIACFTEKGCEDYLKINKHNLKETRIFAAGSYRNNEFRAIRNFLISLGEK